MHFEHQGQCGGLVSAHFGLCDVQRHAAMCHKAVCKIISTSGKASHCINQSGAKIIEQWVESKKQREEKLIVAVCAHPKLFNMSKQ